MSDINHDAAKAQAELFAKNPQGYFTWETVNYGLAYLDLASRLEAANEGADELQSRLDTVTASHCEMLRELHAERHRSDRLVDVIENANGKAFPFAEMQEAMDTIMEDRDNG